ncbi:Uncharacterised protein [uncultured archaeon]|nr:Uncharacterised protein [uncultured archaeon]
MSNKSGKIGMISHDKSTSATTIIVDTALKEVPSKKDTSRRFNCNIRRMTTPPTGAANATPIKTTTAHNSTVVICRIK